VVHVHASRTFPVQKTRWNDQSGSEDYRPQESYPKLSIHQFEEQVLSGDIAGKVLWSLYVTDEHDTHNIVNDYKTYDIACEMYRLLSRDKNPITKDWDIRIEQSFENIVNNKLQR